MEDDILIDNYLKGKLSKEKENAFLDRLKSDVEFNEKLKLELQLYNALDETQWSFVKNTPTELKTYKKLLEENDLINLKKALAQTNSEINPKKTSGNRHLYYYLAAASIVIFLGLQIFFNKGVSNQEMYYNYADFNDLPSFVTRGNANDINNKLINAQKLFEAGKYRESLGIFKPILETTESNASVSIYTGIAQTELNLHEDAEKTFDDLIDSSLFDAQVGYWYKALLYLKQDRVEESKQILDKIISKNLYNKEKAQDLLKELE